jgi:hypothetical protein
LFAASAAGGWAPGMHAVLTHAAEATDLARIIFGAELTLASAWLLGRRLLRPAPLPATLVFGAGAALLSLALFLLHCVRLAIWPAFIVLGAGIFWGARRRASTGQPGSKSWLTLESRWEGRLLCAILGVFGVLYLVHALAPEIQPDAIGYHLGLVRQHLDDRGFSARAAFHDVLPQGMEMLYAMGFAFGRHSAAKLIHFGFLAATIPLILGIGRRLGLPGYASAVGAGLYALSPVAGTSGTSAYTDAALVFYSLAAAYALILWRDTRSDLVAGLLAGFCYAVKMNGLLAAAAGVLFVLAHRRWRPALHVAAGAALMIAPWMLRAYVLTGNPLAPLFNEYFPNAFFYISSERSLISSLRTYPGVTWSAAPLELTIRGSLLQGLIGPVFLLAPLGLLALRRRGAWFALAAALLLSLPWFLNMGARFLMPSLPWIALLMAAALPRAPAWALLVVHAVTCLPPAISLYAEEAAWRLNGFPLAAALRLESEPAYLRRNVWGYRLAELVARHTRPTTRILDLVGLPAAYLRRPITGDWQSAEGGRLAESLATAAYHERGAFQELRASWKERPLRAVRLQWADGPAALWNIQEIELLRGAAKVRAQRGWLLDAEPNVWEAGFALDGFLVSRWSSREPAKPGMYLEVEFPAPTPLSGAAAIMTSPAEQAKIEFLGRGDDGKWRMLSARTDAVPQIALNLRRQATLFVRRRGIGFIVARSGHQGNLVIGRSMTANPVDWGVERVATFDDVGLFRVP